jgi:hypothetical protein
LRGFKKSVGGFIQIFDSGKKNLEWKYMKHLLDIEEGFAVLK